MTQLDVIKNHFHNCAAALGDYGLISKKDLFDGYCDADEADDQAKKSQYFSALMLRYWGKIFKWKDSPKVKGLQLQDENYVAWLTDCINDALYYRSWRPKCHDHAAEAEIKYEHSIWVDNPKYYKDDNAADMSMNFFCGKKIDKELQASNKQVRKANALTISIDGEQQENGDSALDLTGATTEEPVASGANDLINLYLGKKKYVEALILDAIAHQDVYKVEKIKHSDVKYIPTKDENGDEVIGEDGEPVTEAVPDIYFSYKTEFDPRKLVKHLNEIDEKFMLGYFGKKYELNDLETQQAYSTLKTLDNTKLYIYIKKTFIEIKNSPTMLSYLSK